MAIAPRLAGAAILVAAISVGAGNASAQSLTQPPPQRPGQPPVEPPRRGLFRPELTAGWIVDDNLFFRSAGTADLILRVTPSLEARRESPSFGLAARYRFDAERFADHADLTTAFARQDAALNLTMRPTGRVMVGLQGAYQRTQTPGELNLTTGLTSLRTLASRWQAGGQLGWSGMQTSLTAGFDLAVDSLRDGLDTVSQAMRVRLARRPSARREIYVTYLGERRDFRPGPVFLSNVATIGLAWRLTSVTTFTMAAGPRVAAGKLRPDVEATLARRIATRADLSVAYARTQTIAVGVAELIEVDRVTFRAVYRQPDRWEVAFTGGAFRNRWSGTTIRAHDLAAALSRVVAPSVAIVTTFSTTSNQRRGPGAPGFPERIRRNAIVVLLRLTPGRSR
jgi:hypothetical protein